MAEDASEQDLLNDTLDFLFTELQIVDRQAYKEVEVKDATFVFNTTKERKLARAAYDYAKQVASKARITVRTDGGWMDEYPATTASQLLADQLNTPLFQTNVRTFLDIFKSYTDHVAVFGAIDILLNRTLYPYKVSNYIGFIRGFYENIVFSLLFPQPLTERVTPAFVELCYRYASGERDLYEELKPKLTGISLEGGAWIVRGEGQFYVMLNSRRDNGDKYTPAQAAAWVVARFVNREQLPKAEALNQLLTKEDFASVARDTIKIFTKYKSEMFRDQIRVKERFNKILFLLSNLTVTRKSYKDILETMDVLTATDIVFNNDRFEYAGQTKSIFVNKLGRDCLFTSVYKNGKRYRDVDVDSIPSGAPFYTSPEIFTGEWAFTETEMKFFFQDCQNTNKQTDSIEAMVASIIIADKEITQDSTVKRFKDMYKNNLIQLPPGFFTGSYTRTECLSKLSAKINELYRQEAVTLAGRLYKIKDNNKLQAFPANFDELVDPTHSSLANRITPNLFNLLKTSDSLPLSLIVSDDEEFVNLCKALRSGDLVSIDTLRENFDMDPMVLNEVFKPIFVTPAIEKDQLYGPATTFFPTKLEEDLNKALDPTSTSLVKVNDTTYVFRNKFYKVENGELTEARELNTTWDDFRVGLQTTNLTNVPKDAMPAMVHTAGIENSYEFLVRNYHLLLPLYGYDIASYDEKVLLLTDDPRQAPMAVLKPWFEECFVKKPNRLDKNTKSRAKTFNVSPGTENKMPSIMGENLQALQSVKLDSETTLYYKGDLPVLHVYKKSSDRIIPTSTWQIRTAITLNMLEFEFKMIPRREDIKGDYYVTIFAKNEIKSYNNIWDFLGSGFVGTQLQLRAGDTVELPSTFLAKFFTKSINEVSWYDDFPTIAYISYRQEELRQPINPTPKQQQPLIAQEPRWINPASLGYRGPTGKAGMYINSHSYDGL